MRLAKWQKAEFTGVHEHFWRKRNEKIGVFLQTLIKISMNSRIIDAPLGKIPQICADDKFLLSICVNQRSATDSGKYNKFPSLNNENK